MPNVGDGFRGHLPDTNGKRDLRHIVLLRESRQSLFLRYAFLAIRLADPAFSPFAPGRAKGLLKGARKYTGTGEATFRRNIRDAAGLVEDKQMRRPLQTKPVDERLQSLSHPRPEETVEVKGTEAGNRG